MYAMHHAVTKAEKGTMTQQKERKKKQFADKQIS